MNMKNCLGHLILVFYWFPYGLFNVHEQSVGLIVQTFLFSYTTAFFGAVLVFLILFIPRYTTYSSMLYLCGLCGGVWLCPKHCGMVCFNICTYIFLVHIGLVNVSIHVMIVFVDKYLLPVAGIQIT